MFINVKPPKQDGDIVTRKILYLVITTLMLVLHTTSCSKKVELSVDDLLRRAVKYGDTGHWRLALADAERAVELSPSNPNAVVMYALCLEHNQKMTSALNEMEKVGASAFDNFMVQFTLGRMLFNKGNKEDDINYFNSALEPLTRALELRPDSIPTKKLLAMCLSKQGNIVNYDKAFKLFNQLRKTRELVNVPDAYNEAGVVMARSYLEKKDPRKLKYAKAYFTYAYNRGKKNPTVVFNIAVFYDRFLNNKAVAIKLYDRYLRLAKDNFQLSEQYDKVKRRRDLISQ